MATMPKISESEFLDQVIALAHVYRWFCVHFRPARTADGWRTAVSGDGKGWPDVFAVSGSQRWAAELKVGKNKPTGEQTEWLKRLETAGIPAYLWTEIDWPEIESVLRDGPQER